MPKNLKKIIIYIIGFLLLFIGLIMFMSYRFYNSVFRLSYEQVSTSLESNVAHCKTIKDCKLIPGDILIRRYVTKITSDFDESLDPYFTHSAMFLGNDELFEALGNYEIPVNQIAITKLSSSDWFYDDMHNFVVIRPKKNTEEIKEIISSLKNIANDPEYVFGPIKEGRKTVSCSDIILKLLLDKKILTKSSSLPQIITPDYLFWSVVKHGNFEVVGYNINKK